MNYDKDLVVILAPTLKARDHVILDISIACGLTNTYHLI